MRENPRSPEETFPDLQHIIVIKQRQFKNVVGYRVFLFSVIKNMLGGGERIGKNVLSETSRV
jgi:hypothetical protein